MTAPALNPAQFVPPPTAGAGASTSSTPEGAAGAFDALMAALFPPMPAAAAGSGAASTPKVIPVAVDDAAEPDSKIAAASADGSAAVSADDSAAKDAAALAAGLLGAQAATPQATAPAAEDAASTPPAWGRDKAKGAPAQPALLHADLRAGMALKNQPAPETTDAPEAPPVQPDPTAGTAPNSALPPQASAQARASNPPAPATPTPAPPADGADAPAPSAATAADADAQPTPAAPAATATAPTAIAASAALATTLASRPEAAAVQQPAPKPKAERTRTASEEAAQTNLKPREASEKPVFSKSVESAAKTASPQVEPTDTGGAETAVEGETSEPALQAEARTASQSSAATAPAAQPVRGSPETVAALAAQIVKKLDGQSTRFDVELDPAGLGKVDVRVEIGAHGRMVASLTFENPQAAQDLKARSGELHRALEQAGFDLSGGLSFDAAGDQGRQGRAWQEQAQSDRAFPGRAFREALDNAGDADVAASQGALRLRRGVSVGLDLRI